MAKWPHRPASRRRRSRTDFNLRRQWCFTRSRPVHAGVDGAIGDAFPLRWSLTYPVAGRRYGYMRVATTAPSGLPARLIESVFQGDGRPVTVELEPVTQPPAAKRFRPSDFAQRLQPMRLSLSGSEAGQCRRQCAAALCDEQPGRRQRRCLRRRIVPDRWRCHRGDRMAASAMRLPDLRRAEGLRFRSDAVVDHGRLFAMSSTMELHETIMGIAGQAGIWLNRFSVIEAQTSTRCR